MKLTYQGPCVQDGATWFISCLEAGDPINLLTTKRKGDILEIEVDTLDWNTVGRINCLAQAAMLPDDPLDEDLLVTLEDGSMIYLPTWSQLGGR